MTSGDVPPYDGCKGYVIIGYTVDCSQPGNSAGFDTEGDYLLRLSVDWNPESVSNATGFYLGATSRTRQRHVPNVGQGPVNIDTWFEGGNPNSGGRNDDTQQIADQQAAQVEDAEASGEIPPDMIEVATDGGERGSCHARIKIWCPEHIDLGAHSAGKFSWFAVSVGMPDPVTITPSPDPGTPGTGGWVPVTPAMLRGDKVIPVMPGLPIPVGTGDFDPFLDPVNRKRPGPNPPPLKPADPKNGRKLREDTLKRRGTQPPRSNFDLGEDGGTTFGVDDALAAPLETIVVLGNADAKQPSAWCGVDVSQCECVKIVGATDSQGWLTALATGMMRLGARVAMAGGSLIVRDWNDGRKIGVVGVFMSGGGSEWRHIVMGHGDRQWGRSQLWSLDGAQDGRVRSGDDQDRSAPQPADGGWRGCCVRGWCKCHGTADGYVHRGTRGSAERAQQRSADGG